MNKKMDMKNLIRSCKEGGILQLQLDKGVNPASFRSAASEVNREYGYMKFKINVNSVLGVLTIINRPAQ